jgi:Family of unknown function (DUF6879)
MPDLAWWLHHFERSTFRLETLPAYAVPQEEEWFAEWQRSGKLPELTPDTDSWLKLVVEAKLASKQMQRVHLVTPPLNDYLRFEFATQIPSVDCGEDCRVAEAADVERAVERLEDYWLFDETVAILLHYDDEGRFLGTEEAGDVVLYRRQRDLVLSRSVSLKEYLANVDTRGGPPPTW